MDVPQAETPCLVEGTGFRVMLPTKKGNTQNWAYFSLGETILPSESPLGKEIRVIGWVNLRSDFYPRDHC